MSAQPIVTEPAVSPRRVLAARLEPFDSYWQAPADIEAGYRSFAAYYRANYLPHLPANKSAKILVVSCGPGYLVNVLAQAGYQSVIGIDSDPAKVEHARRRGLPCQAAEAFAYLEQRQGEFDVIIPEQELNHLTHEETIDFLRLCHAALRPGGRVIVYAMNGANPFVGAENLAHNIDHFYIVTEYSLAQLLQLGGFRDIKPFALKLYVFWKNPLNYVGLAVTSVLELGMRILFRMYGKKVKVLSKKVAAVAIRE
jgi:SAM-dependent methyltransferase